MIVPEDNLRNAPGAAGSGRRTLVVVAVAVLAAAFVWVAWVHGQIQWYATHDQAQRADAIAVFGAAEYDGRPSPVLRARLDHGLELYQRGLAPLIITLGGGDPAEQHSEGGVGHDYLLAHGVPESAIIAETQSGNTGQSARRLAQIARTNHLRRILAVSDGTHLFRIHALCTHDGLDVFTSPRPVGRAIPLSESFSRTAHEIASYTAWRLHLH
ncbi:YdcF family protein [Acidipila rosea]|uniref:Uncharacterized SAM-binding protein YcdF (DUF218 family) n=1 Tax=Acidipila rosea TaxID=768535 RepID=A0A4R1L6D0_9BACT|nr:YdcF family protein [Acidipila rosea]MBW4026289.1 YdcF family protein [Acidobacteriota bacterium]MBW4044575.1 YdcF family protein [Acidobacteriota bacterium]TCK72747.1 uncharacterized SAM-binding protein YcdF (DUF218 family) [Acidipila rosea]